MSLIAKVLQQIETSPLRELHLEIPEEVLKDLNIESDGTVDLAVLIKICQRLSRIEKLGALSSGQDKLAQKALWQKIFPEESAVQ